MASLQSKRDGRAVFESFSPPPWLTHILVFLVLLFHGDLKQCVAAAQPPSTNQSRELLEMSLEELLRVEANVVQGASRRIQASSQAPASVTLITSSDIKKHGYQTLAEALNSAPGLYVTSDLSYSYLGLRGFNRPGGYNNRFLLMVDGHRLNDNVYDGAQIGAEFPLDIDLVERIEVIRGPGSALYGNNAFLGVINVVTRRGRNLDGVEVSGSGGSYGSGEGRFSYGKKFTNEVELLLSGTYSDNPGPKNLNFTDATGTPWSSRQMAGAKASKLYGTLAWRELSLSTLYSRRESGMPNASFGQDWNDPRSEFVDTWAYVDLKLDHWFDDEKQLIGRLFYDYYRYDGYYPYSGVLNIDKVIGQYWGTDWQYTQKLWDRHTLTLGGECRHNFQQDQANFNEGPGPRVLDDQRSSYNLAAFAQIEFMIRTNLLLDMGGRMDHHSAYKTEVHPRLGLIYQPWRKTTAKALYGTAYRAPNAYENYYDDGFSTVASSGLKPENIQTFELVLEQELHQGLKLNLSAYRYSIKDLINQAFDPGLGMLQFNNLAEVTARGVESSLSYQHESGFQARISYAAQVAKSSGLELENSPNHIAKLHLSVPVYSDKVFISPEVLYNSRSFSAAPGVKANSFWIANLNLFARPINKRMELSAGIYNLLDEKYDLPASADMWQNSGPLIPMGGRSFRVKLTYRF